MVLKGQKSLEMIIGLIMLLVVAAVVIGIFLNYFLESGELDKLRGGANCQTRRQQFISYCESLCSNFINSGNIAQASAFCEEYQNLDLDCDQLPGATYALTKRLKVCEDRIYCFMVTDCNLPRGGKLDWESCKHIECEVYMDLYNGDRGKATLQVIDKIQSGSCALPSDPNENWYDRFGYRTLTCG